MIKIKNIQIVIVDDEEHCRIVLKNQIVKHCNGASIIGEANGVKSGIELIEKNKPDVVFLDIQMNDGNGFDLLNHFDEISFKIIFTTAFDNYAIKAFKYSAVHYLLKPIDYNELIIAYDRAILEINPQEATKAFINTYKNGTFDTLALKTQKKFYVVNISDIEFIEAEGSYCNHNLVTKDIPIMVSKPLKEYVEILSKTNFVRIHKSFLINLDHVKQFEYPSSEITMNSGKKVMVSRRNKGAFLDLVLHRKQIAIIRS